MKHRNFPDDVAGLALETSILGLKDAHAPIQVSKRARSSHTEIGMRNLGLCITLATGAIAVMGSNPADAQRIYGTYRVVPAGTTAKLGLHYLVNDDCSSRGTVAVNVVTPPTGGEILTEAGAGHPRLPAGSKLARCNARRVLGTNVFYRAAPGFSGTDNFVLEDVYPDGTARQFPITVSVR